MNLLRCLPRLMSVLSCWPALAFSADSLRFDQDAARAKDVDQAGRAVGTIAAPPILTIAVGTSVERSVTINLGALIIGIVPMPIQPPVTVPVGTRVKLIAAQANETSAVRWFRDNQALAATGRTLELADVSPADTALYWAVVDLGGGRSTTSAQAELLVTPREGQRLLNLSVLGRISPEQRTLTTGFTIEAAGRSTRTALLVRAVGPGLASFGVGDPLGAPQLRVMDAKGGDVAPANFPFALPTVAEASVRVGAFALPSNSPDVARVYHLPAGAFTAHVASADAGAGTVLLEIYEVPVK